MPPASGLAEVLQTLLALYPGLLAYVASDQRPAQVHFAAARAGDRVYLFAL